MNNVENWYDYYDPLESLETTNNNQTSNLPPFPPELITELPEDQPPHGRLTIVEQVYYECPDCMDTRPHIDSRFSLATESDEIRYDRPMSRVSGEWQKLDFPFPPGLIVIQNMTGRRIRKQPTEEERQRIEKSAIEVGVGFEIVDSQTGKASQQIIPFAYIPAPKIGSKRLISFRFWPISEDVWLKNAWPVDLPHPTQPVEYSEYNLYVIPR